MSILDERLITRLKSLDRWLPRRQTPLPRRPPRARPETAALIDESHTNSDEQDSLQIVVNWQPSLEQALEGLTGVPEHAALLGVCEDGLPFLLDLANPAPGAILVLGDTGSGKTPLLRAILASACHMNSPERVVFSVIAVQPDEYIGLGQAPHCQEVFPVEDPAVGMLIADLLQVAETRKRRGPRDPALILAIDDLASLLPFLDEETFNSLYWLIRHGPRYQIWTLAALPAGQLEQVEPRFLTAFRTRLFGNMHDERLARRLANDDAIAARDLELGRQFLVPYGGEWLRFWICEAEEENQDSGSDSESKGGPE